jgi:hypothetical protein
MKNPVRPASCFLGHLPDILEPDVLEDARARYSQPIRVDRLRLIIAPQNAVHRGSPLMSSMIARTSKANQARPLYLWSS